MLSKNQRSAIWIASICIPLCIAAFWVFGSVLNSVVNRALPRMVRINARREAISKAQNDPRVLKVLGSPIVEGNLRGEPPDIPIETVNNWESVIPINGPHGSGLVYVSTQFNKNDYVYSRLQVALPNSDITIDLLTSK